jgi:hypothetical protein
MENRDRDRMSQRSSSTEAGEQNRRVESEKGREHNSGTSAEFGQKIGRSENLEGGNMRNQKEGGSNIGNHDKDLDNLNREPNRGSGSESYGSSSGRSGAAESDRDIGRNVDRDDVSKSDFSKEEGRH